MSKTEKIYQTTLDIIKMSNNEGIPTYMAANRLAEERIEQNRK